MTTNPIPYGYCQCGCGELAPISKYTSAPRGYRKGEPRFFIWGHSSKGRVLRSPIAEGIDFRVQDCGYITPCWVWLRPLSKKGYGNAYSYRTRTARPAHQVVWEEHHGIAFPKGLQADHLCRNRSCVNPQHIEPVTALVNSRRRIDAKLTDDDRVTIVQLHGIGYSQRELGRKFKVDGRVISSVLRRPPGWIKPSTIST